MEEVRGRGARWVVVTAGRDAVWALGEGGFRRFRPPAVKALNPIGSGDSLATGIACSVVRGADPVEAIRYGVACGSANAETLLPGDFDPARAEELAARVDVEPVK
jgi:fructose-1-phosphate kinase PfkB-like protein